MGRLTRWCGRISAVIVIIIMVEKSRIKGQRKRVPCSSMQRILVRCFFVLDVSAMGAKLL